MVVINPYKNGSRGAKALKEGLRSKGVKSFTLQRPPKDPRALIINWGNSEFSYSTDNRTIINHPGLLGVMTNKLRFFNKVGHIDMVPQWTVSPGEALAWKSKLLARTILEGSGGAGIVVYDPTVESDFPRAPLYVKYENKTHEYRIHMGRSLRGGEFEPLLIQRKVFQKSPDNPAPKSWEVRNHANGFVYVRNSDDPVPDTVIQTARDFMGKYFSGLHFAALDIIYNNKKKHAWVLEGNTAPGLEGNTIDVYSEYFARLNQEARRA